MMPEGAVPLWVADMDFRCAPAIGEALARRAAHPCYGYTMVTDEDIAAFLAYNERRHGLRNAAEDVLMLPCVVTGLKLFVRCFTEPGERVAILTPVYGPFTFRRAQRPEGRAGGADPGRDDRYQIDFDRLEEAFRAASALMLMCSPHNPVGRCWTREELEKVLALTRRYGVKLCVDEIHAEFVFAPQRFVPILSLTEAGDEVVSLMSASKTFNIAGLQQACPDPKPGALLEALGKERDAAGVVTGNIFALEGTRAAWTEGETWLDGLMDYLTGNLQLLGRLLKENLPFARMSPVEATYLAWLDLRAYEGSCARLSQKFRHAGVALTSGTFFGPEGEGFMRLNFGCPAAQLTEGVKRMKSCEHRMSNDVKEK